MTRSLPLLALVLAFGCGGRAVTRDSGTGRDAGGGLDAGRADAGAGMDAGADAGSSSDSGPGDAGGGGDAAAVDAASIDAGPTDAGPPVDANLPSCVDMRVTAVGAAVATGNTTGMGDDFGGLLCETPGDEAEDMAILFVAPDAGSYVFDVVAPDFDAVLSVHDPDCSNPKERFCVDDTADSYDPTGAITLAAGEEIIVAVDGLGAEDVGAWTLNVTRIADTCPDMDLGTSSGAFTQTLLTGAVLGAGASDNRTASCTFGGGGKDLAYRWTAGGAGEYRFVVVTATSASFDSVLYVLDGDCAGDELGCNDDSTMPSEDSAVSVTLTAGQTVIIVVEGFTAGEEGTFDLTVEGPI